MKATQLMNNLNYDPCDQNSVPYQADDPPFNADRLKLEPGTLDSIDTLDLDAFIEAWLKSGGNHKIMPNHHEEMKFTVMDMALRLFRAMTNDPDNAYEGIDYPTLFAAALDTSNIWMYG
jgi:hypothetical protein